MTKPCKIDRVTGLFEKGCEFIPDGEQTEKASIMFSQNVNSVSIFPPPPQHCEFNEVSIPDAAGKDQILGRHH